MKRKTLPRALALAALAGSSLIFAGELRKAIEFAQPAGESLKIDAWIPDGPGPHPAVIIVHGGGWVNGDRNTYVPPLFPPLTNAGFAWFTIDYRLAPKHPYPAAVEDVKTAIRWVKAHAAEFRVDPKRLALMGESAGGHLASLVGTQNEPDTAVAAVVPFYGVHDMTVFTTITENRAKFLGFTDPSTPAAQKILREASPITYARPGLPPFLMVHGTKDAQVPYDQSILMCAKLRLLGVSCELYTVDGGAHGVGSWERDSAQQGYKLKMVEWLRRRLSAR